MKIRKCNVYETVAKVGEPRLAMFHAWSQDYEGFESGPVNFPVAIVEFPNGVVQLVYAPLIEFTDPLNFENEEA